MPSRLGGSVCPTWCRRPDTGEASKACCGAFNSSWFWQRRAEVEARCSDNPWDVMGTGEGAGGGVRLQMHWSVMVPAAIRSVSASLGAREQLAGAIYHFGVYNGRSLFELLKWFPFAPHYAFDSFVGLPNEASDEMWVQKNFRAGAYAATRSARALRTRLGPDASNVKIVPGFFNVSLSSQLAASLQPAAYVHMDVDLYVSTVQSLEWMLEHRLLRVGSLIGYDDIWASPCSAGGEGVDPLEMGEGRAHVEIARRHGVAFRCVAGSCDARKCSRDSYGMIFVVTQLGGEPDPGFGFSAAELEEWRANSPVCRWKRRRRSHGVTRRVVV